MTRISEFRSKGYVLVDGLLSKDAIEELIRNLDEMSGGQEVPVDGRFPMV